MILSKDNDKHALTKRNEITISRYSGRQYDEMRPVTIERNVNIHAEGSCLIKSGNTHIICTATIDERVPNWMRGQGKGWVTAEYGMLPRSTGTRIDREAARGKQTGRTQEIQRLIGRALRSVVSMEKLGERQIRIDCDVIQADGGTRTAAVTGGFVALRDAITNLRKSRKISSDPITDSVAAISCGIFRGFPVLDLDYEEDSNIDTDANFVITGKGDIVEIQATAEQAPFSEQVFGELLTLARKGCQELQIIQAETLNG